MRLESMDLSDVRREAGELVSTVGPTLAAIACDGNSTHSVADWSKDYNTVPQDDQLTRLLEANRLLRIVIDKCGREEAAHWFLGSSCEVQAIKMSPAEAIRNFNFDAAHDSALRFIEDAYM